ncbi:MAG: efflux RND transporter periplasmic adaptor subunit [Lentisphaerae bacterium]|nr:efflux RND transporter periplasmic adaptor subunit [Lentisphaerota bacterium]
MRNEITREIAECAKIAPVAILLLLLTLLGTGCGKGGKGEAQSAGAAVTMVSVRAEAATERNFERRLTVQGTIEAKVFANVAARVGGNLDALWVDEGDSVVAGQTRLFQIDPIALSNSVTAAEQSLKVAQAGLAVAVATCEKAEAEADKAKLDFSRFERLHKEGRVSDNEFETADTRNRQAAAGLAMAQAQILLQQSQIDQAAAALQIARKNLEDALAVAPITGVVSKRSAEPGEQMAVGKVVLAIVDPDSLEAAAFVPAQYYSDVIPGETTFRLSVDGREIGNCKVYYRSPTINPTLRTFEIKGRLEERAEGAVPGAMAELTMVFEQRKGVAIRSEAVLSRGGKPALFVVESGQARQREVTIGWQNDGLSEVLTGLAAGDVTVYEGQTLLRDGIAVDVR